MKKVVCAGSATIDVLVRSKDFRVMKSHQVTGGVALCEVYGGKTEATEIVLQTGGLGDECGGGINTSRYGEFCYHPSGPGLPEGKDHQ